MLIIEADGLSHEIEDVATKDNERDNLLSKIGFTVLRYSSWEVLNRLPNVSEGICRWIQENRK